MKNVQSKRIMPLIWQHLRIIVGIVSKAESFIENPAWYMKNGMCFYDIRVC